MPLDRDVAARYPLLMTSSAQDDPFRRLAILAAALSMPGLLLVIRRAPGSFLQICRLE
jgi:hypothetical protein